MIFGVAQAPSALISGCRLPPVSIIWGFRACAAQPEGAARPADVAAPPRWGKEGGRGGGKEGGPDGGAAAPGPR